MDIRTIGQVFISRCIQSHILWYRSLSHSIACLYLLMVHILNFNTLTNVRQQRHGESTSEMFAKFSKTVDKEKLTLCILTSCMTGCQS